MDELRMYSFVNQYISGIHAGIQSAHSIVEMFNEYEGGDRIQPLETLRDWAENHKTLIVLEGGYQSNLETVEAELRRLVGDKFPISSFRESRDALNGALTAVTIVLPEYIFKSKVPEEGESQTVHYHFPERGAYVTLTPNETLALKILKKHRLKGA